MSDELWGKCPKCSRWFFIEDPGLQAFYRCPVCLTPGQEYERRIVLDDDR